MWWIAGLEAVAPVRSLMFDFFLSKTCNSILEVGRD